MAAALDSRPADAESSDEEEEFKRAFFQELEARHGKPVTWHDDLRHWDAALDATEAPPEANSHFNSDGAAMPGAALSAPRSPVIPSKKALPEGGWLTPTTPPFQQQQQMRKSREVAAAAGKPLAHHLDDIAFPEDVVVTDSLTSRCCSRAGATAAAPMGALDTPNTVAPATPPLPPAAAPAITTPRGGGEGLSPPLASSRRAR